MPDTSRRRAVVQTMSSSRSAGLDGMTQQPDVTGQDRHPGEVPTDRVDQEPGLIPIGSHGIQSCACGDLHDELDKQDATEIACLCRTPRPRYVVVRR